MFIVILMTRMISVMDDTYDRLKNMKGNKSFTELLNGLMDDKSRKILMFAGALKEEWKDMDSQKYIKKIREGDIEADKKHFNKLKKHWEA